MDRAALALSSRSVLDMYLHDVHAGKLARDDSGQLSFRYTEAYRAQPDRPAIPYSMPVAPVVYGDRFKRPYFSGLLPDAKARHKLTKALGVSEGNAFGLLEIIGGECAGALSLYPEGERPPEDDDHGIEPLSEVRLVQVLEQLRARPLLGGEDGVRLSLAGALDKLAVCLQDETVALALGGAPTTHILKPFIPRSMARSRSSCSACAWPRAWACPRRKSPCIGPEIIPICWWSVTTAGSAVTESSRACISKNSARPCAFFPNSIQGEGRSGTERHLTLAPPNLGPGERRPSPKANFHYSPGSQPKQRIGLFTQPKRKWAPLQGGARGYRALPENASIGKLGPKTFKH